MKEKVILWSVLTIMYILIAVALDVGVLFQLGIWTAGQTDYFWSVGLVISQIALLVSVVRCEFVLSSLFFTVPVVTTVYAKSLYYFIIGCMYQFSSEVMLYFALSGMILVLYTLLFRKLLDISKLGVYIALMGVCIAPISYQFAVYTKHESGKAESPVMTRVFQPSVQAAFAGRANPK